VPKVAEIHVGLIRLARAGLIEPNDDLLVERPYPRKGRRLSFAVPRPAQRKKYGIAETLCLTSGVAQDGNARLRLLGAQARLATRELGDLTSVAPGVLETPTPAGAVDRGRVGELRTRAHFPRRQSTVPGRRTYQRLTEGKQMS
jgi:hypothetical protein